LEQVIKAKKSTVLGAFAATSATAPVIGVVFGGWYVDKMGGYQGVQGKAMTGRCCAFFGTVATAFAICAGYAETMVSLLSLIWCVLFFGGAVIPGATGLVLSSVPPQLRSFSSAVSMLTYNIFGYAAGKSARDQ
jgi:MFS family permease